MKIKLLLFCKFSFLLFLFVLVLPVDSVSEFYQYINEDGVKCYTDDASLISEIEEKKVTVHKDKYDGLSEEEKKILREREEQEILEQRQRTQRALDTYRLNESIKDAKKRKEENFRKRTTRVLIANNRIIVPVTIGYSGREHNTSLLLDTGASITVIHNSIAEQLEINTGVKSSATVAGGGTVRTKIVDIEYIKVGPKTYKNPKIMVLRNKGSSGGLHGLLGQDFLSHFNYTIDYKNSLIVWR
jgi:predicted aspartyl protease